MNERTCRLLGGCFLIVVLALDCWPIQPVPARCDQPKAAVPRAGATGPARLAGPTQ